MKSKELHLIYVNPIGDNSNGWHEYEFFFSETPENIWGIDWAEQCPSICDNVMPDSEYIDEVKRLKSNIPFFCAQENSCFSMQDCIDGIISICFEDISEYEEYPEPYRIVFKFGETLRDVENKLASRHQLFQEN